VNRDQNGIALPEGRYLSDIEIQRARVQLVGLIREAARLELWPDAHREWTIAIALNSPRYALMPDLHYFREHVRAARPGHP
jgi:hypothetical protein